MTDLANAQAQFEPEPGWLNTASYGLPPRVAWDEMQAALGDWRHGRVSWEGWGVSTERARAAFARLVGASPSDVAVGSQVSQMIGVVAASLPAGARVLVPEVEFASNLFPYLVHESRGLVVDTTPLELLVERIDESVDAVALSVVQSADGTVTDLTAVSAAARAADALVVIDATQAVGWLPLAVTGVDVLACAAYKWLCSPRGSGFLYVAPEVRDRLLPVAAGWYSCADIHASYYGPPLRLATDARRFDLSPAWQAWTGTAPAIELIADVGVGAIHDHDIGLANRFRAGLGLPPSDSAIVSASVDDAESRLAAAGVRAASRAGSLRVSFHLYNTEADVDTALAALLA